MCSDRKQRWYTPRQECTNHLIHHSCCVLDNIASVPGGHMYTLMGFFWLLLTASSVTLNPFATYTTFPALHSLDECTHVIVFHVPSPSWSPFPAAALEAPRYKRSLTNQTVNVTESLRMECDVEGRPLPRLSWFKDNQPLHQMSGAEICPRRWRAHLHNSSGAHLPTQQLHTCALTHQQEVWKFVLVELN